MSLISSPRSSGIGYKLPEWRHNNVSMIRELLNVVRNIMRGKINVAKEITLTENQTSTTISDSRIGRTTVLVLAPATANAAAAVATTYQTYPNATSEQAVINHANNAQTDRTFAAVLIG